MITAIVGLAAFAAGYAFRGLIHKEIVAVGADVKAADAKADAKAVAEVKAKL
jgi:hypothetical protein